mgnify:CR=1 FL=1
MAVHDEDVEFLKHYGYEAQKRKALEAQNKPLTTEAKKGISLIDSLFDSPKA